MYFNVSSCYNEILKAQLFELEKLSLKYLMNKENKFLINQTIKIFNLPLFSLEPVIKPTAINSNYMPLINNSNATNTHLVTFYLHKYDCCKSFCLIISPSSAIHICFVHRSNPSTPIIHVLC